MSGGYESSEPDPANPRTGSLAVVVKHGSADPMPGGLIEDRRGCYGPGGPNVGEVESLRSPIGYRESSIVTCGAVHAVERCSGKANGIRKKS